MQRVIKPRVIFYSFILLVFIISGHTNVTAQLVSKVSIQASGLTCSLCSNAIYKALLSIDYVDKIDVDIKDSKFEISFKPHANVSFDDLKNKVESAGFFVATMEATYSLGQLAVKDEDHVQLDGKLFHFMNVGSKTFSSSITLRIIDKGYVTAKEFKKNSRYTQMNCYQSGHIGACCHQDGDRLGARIYHVTI